jgi:hypothetical protein
MKTPSEISARARSVFSAAGDRIKAGCHALHAAQSAAGQLQSGATIKKAVRIYAEESALALKQIADEVALQIRHRGRAWAAGMDAVAGELELHIANAPAYLEQSFTLANSGASATEAGHALIAGRSGDLRAQLHEFRDGWTAPVPEAWDQRHRVVYAVILLVAGAILSAVLT